MAQNQAGIQAEVDRLVNAAEADTAEGLCRLSAAQQAFDRVAREMAQRAGSVPLPAAAEAGIKTGGVLECWEEKGRVVPSQLQQVFWLLVVGLSSASFAVGYWFGRQAH